MTRLKTFGVFGVRKRAEIGQFSDKIWLSFGFKKVIYWLGHSFRHLQIIIRLDLFLLQLLFHYLRNVSSYEHNRSYNDCYKSRNVSNNTR